MSFASLVGLPDIPKRGSSSGAPTLDLWHLLRSELDMLGAPDASMPSELTELGDQPCFAEITHQTGSAETFVVECRSGMWREIEHYSSQPSPDDGHCWLCRVARSATAIWRADTAAEHIF